MVRTIYRVNPACSECVEVCQNCTTVEDEFHVVPGCPIHPHIQEVDTSAYYSLAHSQICVLGG
jgi:hypothetical protein